MDPTKEKVVTKTTPCLSTSLKVSRDLTQSTDQDRVLKEEDHQTPPPSRRRSPPT